MDTFHFNTSQTSMHTCTYIELAVSFGCPLTKELVKIPRETYSNHKLTFMKLKLVSSPVFSPGSVVPSLLEAAHLFAEL